MTSVLSVPAIATRNFTQIPPLSVNSIVIMQKRECRYLGVYSAFLHATYKH